MSPEVEALAAKIEAAFAGAGTAAAAGQAALAAAVEAAFPGLRERTGRGGAARASVSNAARLACQRLTRRALDAGEAPMRWAPPGAAAPALPLLLDRLYGLAQASLTDHPPVATVSGLLEEVADASSGEACGDVLDFLAAREATFREVRDNKMPLLRLCNRLLARFSRASEPQLCAAALVFLAKAVPPGAVDSSGQPVDALLYAATWGLQPLLANPRETATPDAWAKFVAGVRTVLAALSAQPAQVAAGATGAAGAGGGEGTVGYLSSPQLFGLQLRDATFRRALLVQVLVLLQAVQGPVKAADPTLRAKQQPEAAALEAEVYAALEATPDDGKAFVAALRGVLRRAEGWVQWKRGGPPPAPAPKDAKACPDYERPPLEPGLAERVAEGEQKAAAAAARAQARRDA
ncbi:hypothetical protein Rsub_12382 [Raphidocelis subcapitata]|uniref:Uncharacterized protein n=1 Tax=Raphidocelis subcapitata TaxID=307507 RepID=A0A2V0PIS1_9CHLO|nr:hypothetical protein Rsub_12382 [Raphidocelis subcapitata]|eukprot:GBF99688.1 hypothetical protein Rsub_12382 [Raphidocelis subcapitata]